MIWIIESKSKISREFAADVKRLRANKAVAQHVTRAVLNSTIAEMQTPLKPALKPGEPVLILAHSGYDIDPRSGQEAPWIGGRWLDEFAQDLAAKFTPAGISGHTLWFLVCHTGHDISALANHLVTAGVDNVTIYLPKNFMYVSKTGIPHVLLSDADLDDVNRDVARCDSDYWSIQGSQATGSYWAGCSISGQTVTPLSSAAVEQAVQAQFDPNEEES
ncbi:hypothetical protein ACIBQ2_28170 [Micromonospora sediminimaris]|uniref:Uncharacterized protein n=1 Tax=Micromonospora sediminimaris TaxID=547162 RepID=A0A9W5UUA4_9ACTN|nr:MULTISPECIES: hypothetical protein [Micromonospora]WFE43757.1 hypothetical protein O7624_05135 [Verrucosispora sp. WMMD1129]GIJ35954.1 hypothetical protein Vse01_51020 [Micromonospora sediminimaris]SFC87609.1 hypothetical protein SAMN05216284_10846 [Micromonospora sediminimaris]